MVRFAPYGEWESPISAADAAAAAHRPVEAAYAGDTIWWSEPIAAENRVGVFREGVDGPESLLPAPWSARSREHEYGGGAWATDGRSLVFVEASDQRIHRVEPDALDPGARSPVALVPEDDAVRYGGLIVHDGRVLAVRERRTGERPTDVERDIVTVPVDGSAPLTPVVGGSRFLAHPSVSRDGRRIAWLAWDHPSMPWQSSEIRVGVLVDGRVQRWSTVAGGPGESVLQPEWAADGSLRLLSDRTGWWNLYALDGALDASGEAERLRPLLPRDRETGGPFWEHGTRWYRLGDDGGAVLVSTLGDDEVVVLDTDGSARTLRAGRSRASIAAVRQGRALVIDDAPDGSGGLSELDLASGAVRLVRGAVDGLPATHLPEAQPRTFDGVHAIVYPPRNPDFAAPPGRLPPFVVMVHGGPTSHRGPQLSTAFAYCTSRGIGVVDVNYGGSTGYGRAYRERLDGQWGVVDVDDVVTVARGLAEGGVADPARIAVEGGSAGGWTVLSALVFTSAFACGISRYGVADLVALAEDTHDFEAHYLDGLVGPYPEVAERYAERAPVNHVERLDRPVLLLQGLDDRVVPPAQSQRFRDALVARGILHAHLEFAGEGHGFRRRETQIAVQEAALSFLGQVLGFEPPDVARLILWRPDGKAEEAPSVAPATSATSASTRIPS